MYIVFSILGAPSAVLRATWAIRLGFTPLWSFCGCPMHLRPAAPQEFYGMNAIKNILMVSLKISPWNMSYEMLWDVMRCYEMLWDVMRCYEMLWDVMRCYEMLWDVMRCYEISSLALKWLFAWGFHIGFAWGNTRTRHIWRLDFGEIGEYKHVHRKLWSFISYI